jgi:apolipoprotein N-acyltransferase
MISPTLGDTGIYAKSKLVPFGEYVPYRKIFSFLQVLEVSINDMGAGGPNQMPLQSGIAAGEDRGNVPYNRVVVGPMICFESTYSRFARRQAAMGATLLSVVTDDTWFGRTAAAQQHLEMSAIRASETHRSLVRSAATGISAIFDSRGRMISELGWYKKGILVADVPIETTLTPYVRYGDWFVIICAIGWFAAVISSIKPSARV